MEHYNEVLDFINTYKSNTYVYQRVIKRRFKIDGMTVYAILEKMADDDILERVFGIICSKCAYENDAVYTSLNQLSDLDLICHKCRHDLNIAEDIILYYKKI